MEGYKIDYDNLDVEALMTQIRKKVLEKKATSRATQSSQGIMKVSSGKVTDPKKSKSSKPDKGRPARKTKAAAGKEKLKREDESGAPLVFSSQQEKIQQDQVETLERIDDLERTLSRFEDLEQRIVEKMRSTRFEDLQDDDFVTEALQCIGEWNISISIEDLYRSHPSLKGKIIRSIRGITSKLFKLVMNIDVLFPQFHKQAVLNQTYIILLHTLVQEISNLNNLLYDQKRDLLYDLESLKRDLVQLRLEKEQLLLEKDRIREELLQQYQIADQISKDLRDVRDELVDSVINVRDELVENMLTDKRELLQTFAHDLSRLEYKLDTDLKRSWGELVRDMTSDKNDFRRSINSIDNDIQQIDYKLDGLKGLIEGQRQQIEYIQARQRALEKLAVLREEQKAAGQKTTEIQRGRYKSGKNRTVSKKGNR